MQLSLILLKLVNLKYISAQDFNRYVPLCMKVEFVTEKKELYAKICLVF